MRVNVQPAPIVLRTMMPPPWLRMAVSFSDRSVLQIDGETDLRAPNEAWHLVHVAQMVQRKARAIERNADLRAELEPRVP